MTLDNIELAVVMPVYNEQDAILNVVNKWTKELEKLNINFEFHIYNDGSTDNTFEILKDLALKNKKNIVHNKKNSGHGPTIILGYRENSDIKWVFQTDSDDEIPPDSFSELWHNRREYDFLIGKRDGRYQPFSRKIISLISRITIRILYGKGVYDVNSPYRLMRTSKFKDIFYSIPANTFAPNVIISGIVELRKMRIFEIPVSHQNRRTGEVSIKKWKLLKSAISSWTQTVKFRFTMIRLEYFIT